MARTRTHRYGLLVLAALTAFSLGTVDASPIPLQITYSTSGPDVPRGPSALSPYEFRPVTDGVAALGSDLKLGTLLIHRQQPSPTMPTMAIPFPIEFRVTKVGEEPVSPGGASVQIDNFINHYIQDDGTVVGNMETFIHMDPIDGGKYDPIQVGPISLTLKPVAVPPTWDQRPDQEVVAVDVLARLDGTPVPEPSVLLIFAAAAGFGWRRLGNRKPRRS